ncbi:MAG: PP2C family protein-serine/threonine phosphatase [Actinomycetales bacterium]
MVQQPLILRYAARSDVGLVRAKNDDSAYAGRFLAVVADGMGGHAGGDVASASTVLDLIHLDHDGYDGDAGTHLADEIQTANSLLSELVHVNPKLAGMGTTVTALLLSGDKLEFAHIGDSRAYRLKNGVYEQISIDHTFVQRLIDEGRLSPAEAETHPHKNVLMRVLGDVDASPELDLTTFDAEPGERWLLCSDGLNFVRPTVVEDVLRSTADLAECADRLITLTLEAGSPDNVTVVVFEVARAEETHTARLDAVPVAQAQPGAQAQTVAQPAELSGQHPPAVVRTEDPEATAAQAAVGSSAAQAADPDDDGAGTVEVLGAHLSDDVIRQELAERAHELVGAAVTAAKEGKIPTIAGRTAARRAAMVLTHRTEAAKAAEDSVQEAADDAAPGLRRRILIIVGVLVLVGLAIGLWLGYAWTQTRFYVGQSNGHVAIYNGVSQSLGPIPLAHVYSETSLQVSSLPAFSQQQVNQTLPAASLADARQIISNLQLGSRSGPSCTPLNGTASPSAAASASTTASARPTPSAAPTAAPTAAPSSSAPAATAAPSTGLSAICPGGGK